jgi:hypothetical protein
VGQLAEVKVGAHPDLESSRSLRVKPQPGERNRGRVEQLPDLQARWKSERKDLDFQHSRLLEY